MTATVPFIQETFEKYNELCFQSSLPPIPIKLTRARSFLGKVTYIGRRDFFGNVVGYDNFTLRISTLFDLTKRELEDVIIHEMIHYYIAKKGIKDTSTHGEVFRRIMSTINTRYGRNVSISHHGGTGATLPQEGKIRINWLCITQLQDGNWGITSCSKKKISEIDRGLPRFYRLKSLEWYTSADPFFNRYPRSIKPRIYKITRAELDEHLKSCTLVGRL